MRYDRMAKIGWSATALAMCLWTAAGPAAGNPVGRNYFVDQGHAAAADGNAGTEDSPFKSIRGALTAVQLEPGDSLWIKDGVYREFVWIEPSEMLYQDGWSSVVQTNSGLSHAAPITFAAYPGHAPVITGSDVVTNWSRFTNDIWVADWPVNSQQVFANGKVLQQIAGEMTFPRRFWRGRLGEGIQDMTAGSFYCDLAEKKLYVWLPEKGNPNDCLIEASVRPGLFWLGPRSKAYSFFRVIGLRFRHSNSSAFAGSAMLTLTGRSHIMEDCDASWSDGGGAGVVGDDHTLNRCVFNHNGLVGLGASNTRGLRVLNCETSYNNYRGFNPSWSGGGCKFIPANHDMVIRGHVATENVASCGIWFDAANANVTIENCLVYRNGGAGIMYEISTRGLIRNNICYENGHRGIYVSDSSYMAVLNNLCYRNGMSGIAVVAHNRPVGVHGRGPDDVCPAGHNVVWGNVLVDNCWPELAREGWSGRPELLMPPEEGIHAGNISDYNLFYRSGEREKQPLQFARNYDAASSSLEEWREKTGMDVHSVVARPIFRDEAHYDFHPLAESPAVMMVKPEMGVGMDFDNLPRPSKFYHTAGPFATPPEVISRLQTRPAINRHRMIMPTEIKRAGRPAEHSVLAAYFAVRSLQKRIAPGIYGMQVDDIPFRLEPKNDLVLDADCRSATITLDRQVRMLHLLCMAAEASDKPIARAVIHLKDGTDRQVEWRQAADGALVSSPATDTVTTAAVQSTDLGYRQFLQRQQEKVDYRIFMTRWTNDNEWYAVTTLELELLDPNAIWCIFAVTSEDLAE